MDFPGELIRTPGATDSAAKGLAGQVVALIEDEVREAVSFDVASKTLAGVDAHAAAWRAPPGGPARPPAHRRAPEENPELRSMLRRFRVALERAGEVRALALQSLSSGLDAQTFATIVRAMPHLIR
ncbi:MAG: hypothetical protein AB1730_26115 [Myxococcota bacterium]|jgi:hypothetical protein